VRYLLSPHDLAGHEALPALLEAGVVSFKIEGRLKQPEYVAATTALYRQALDRALGGRKRDLLGEAELRTLGQVYSRGQSPGFLSGTDHQAILDGTYPRHRGLRLGPVVGVTPALNGVSVRLEEELERGDDVLLAGGDPEQPEPGGRVAGLQVEGREVERAPRGAVALLTFETRSLRVADAPPGAVAWRTGSPALERRLRAGFEGEAPRRLAPITLHAQGRAGEPLAVVARDDQGHEARAASQVPLAPAARSPLDRELLQDKLGRLGGTPFALEGLELALEGPLHLPVSELNRVRRELVDALLDARGAPPERVLAEPARAAALIAADRAARAAAPAGAPAGAPLLVPLCRNDAHLEGALAAGAREVVLEWMEMVGLRRGVERARAAGARVVIAPPRIQKPGDERVLEACLRLEPEGLLVRSLGALELLARGGLPAGATLHGDFSLNAANALGARVLLDKGLATFVPAYDLSFVELERLLEHVDPARAEVVVHQHLPMFHTEYCAYARLISPVEGFAGHSFQDCGRPCERHRLSLRDRTGQAHPVLVDVGCRNTVFSAQANSVADDLPRLLELGVRRFRVELLEQDARAAEALVRGYQEALAGRRSGAQVRTAARAVRRLGVLRVEG
jgi:putative protease